MNATKATMPLLPKSAAVGGETTEFGTVVDDKLVQHIHDEDVREVMETICDGDDLA